MKPTTPEEDYYAFARSKVSRLHHTRRPSTPGHCILCDEKIMELVTMEGVTSLLRTPQYAEVTVFLSCADPFEHLGCALCGSKMRVAICTRCRHAGRRLDAAICGLIAEKNFAGWTLQCEWSVARGRMKKDDATRHLTSMAAHTLTKRSVLHA